MEKVENQQKKIVLCEKMLSLIIVVGLSISAIPMVIIGEYNSISADDYAIGKYVSKLWNQSGNILRVIQYALVYTKENYLQHKGVYTVSFLDVFNAGFIDESLAWITPVVMLTVSSAFFYVFCRCLLKRLCHASRWQCIMIWGILSFLILQTLPAPVEQLYWYAGAIGYTFTHYFVLMVIGIYFLYENKVAGILLSFMMFLTGGSQYNSLLPSLFIATAILVHDFRKQPRKVIPWLFLVLGAGINILAPGNRVRGEAANGMAPIEAIVRSFPEAVHYGKEWLSPLLAAVCLLLIPTFWKLMKNVAEEIKFCHPIIMSIGAVLLYVVCFTPSLYGVGNVDSGRLHNIIQSWYYLIFLSLMGYWIGWLQRKNIVQPKREEKMLCIWQWAALLLMILVFVITGNERQYTAVSAVQSLKTGEAEAYYEENQERLKIYRDPAIKIAVINPYTVKPRLLYFNDIQPENSVDEWINRNVAIYYGKEKVILNEE